jgi:predicted ATPase
MVAKSQKILESSVTILLELAERQPVLFILEDLHWTDPTSQEFLGLLVEQVPASAIYTLLTCSPHFQPAWHHRSYLTEVTVNRLSRQQIKRMAQHVAGGKMLPTEIVQQLVDKTDGVPLYVEEMTKAVLESGLLKEADGQYELNRLIEAELVYQRGLPPQAMYTFKHALIQDTAYESLLVSSSLLVSVLSRA